MAVTRIQNNQITDSTITAAKIAPYTLTGGLFANSITLNSNVSVVGNLQVSGTSTTVNSVNTYVNDPLIVFNNGYVGVPSYDIGMVVNRNLQSLGSYGNFNTAWIWDETAGAFTGVLTTETGSTTGAIDKSYLANIKIGNLNVVESATFGTAAFTNLTTSGTIISSGNIVAASGTASTNTTTGALVVAGSGGAGIGGALNVGGITKIAGNLVASSTTASTDTTTGSFIALGGAGIAGNVVAGGQVQAATGLYSSGNFNGGYTGGIVVDYSSLGVGQISVGSSDAIKFYTGGVANTETLVIDSTGNIVIPATTTSTNTTTGALVVKGGTGIVGTLNVGAAAAFSSTITASGNIVAASGTASDDTTTGALIVIGGLGVTGNIHAGSINNTPIGNAVPSTGDFTNLHVATGFSTANAVITGGSIDSTPIGASNPSTGDFTYLRATTGFSTANAVISGGYISSLTNATITTANVTTLNVTGQTTLANVTTGNITADSITTAGTSGNIFGVNNLSATSINTGTLVATGNITGNNITATNKITAGEISVTSFSTANAEITGGNVTGLTNFSATNGSITNFSTGNAQITGGNLSNIDNISVTALDSGSILAFDTNTYSLTACTVAIYGGNITGMSNVESTYGKITNFSSGNAVITGGYINSVTNVYATTGSITNFSTGNAVISGGYINNSPIGNATPNTGKFTSLTATLVTEITDSTESTTFADGALIVSGGVGINKNLNVGGNATISGNLTVNGTLEYINTTVTTVVDPILELNTGPSGAALTGGSNDSGIRTHYYSGSDQSSFFGRVNSSGNFEYYSVVSGETGNVISGTYGTIKSGALLLANTTASTSTTEGALQVAGGAGIAGNLYVGGAIFSAGGAGANFAAINNTPIGNTTPSTGSFTYLNATVGFSTANAVITGGNVTGITNLTSTNETVTNFSTGNAQITGGDVTGLTTFTATTGNITNFGTGNAQITGGNVTGITNVTATYENPTNFSTANAVITGGSATNLSTLTATTGNITNFGTANAQITGGNVTSITNFQGTNANFTNFASANLLITSEKVATLDVTANLYVVPQNGVATVTINPLNIGFIDNMTIGASYQANAYVTNFKAVTSLVAPTTGIINLNAGILSGSGINGIPIGATNPQLGVFTSGTMNTLQANTSANTNVLTAITGTVTNLTSSNVTITGGYINSVTNVYATTGSITNFITGNAVISGGYINNSPIGNATPNSGAFTTLSAGGATTLNTATAASLQALAIGNVTPGTGAFTTLTTTGNVKASGNIMVLNGNTTTYDDTTATALTNGALIATGTGGLAVGGNAHIGGGVVINGTQSTYDTYIRGVNDTTLMYAVADATYDQLVVGGNMSVGSLIQGAKFIVNSTDAMMIPAGVQGERPSGQGFTDVAGMVRFNTTNNQLEFYNGSIWSGTGSSFTIVSDQQFSVASGNPAGNVDGVNDTFTLTNPGTTASAIVSLNGVLQIPTLAYSITGASNDQLVFTEPPHIGDIIDVRILTTTSTVGSLASANGYNSIVMNAANIQVTTGSASAIERWIWNLDGDLIPTLEANIGSSSYPVGELFVSNITLTGGTITGASLGGSAINDTPIGNAIPQSGAFTTLAATTYANVEVLVVNTSATVSSIVSNDNNGYAVYENDTGPVATFDKTVYRGGKFLVQLSTVDDTYFQLAEIVAVHNDSTVTLETYGVTSTSGNTMATFSANIVAGVVNINATTSTWANVTAKVLPTLMPI